MSSEALVNIDVQGDLPKVASGKVRDLYAIDDSTLLFVASDRISAYDVIMENVRPNINRYIPIHRGLLSTTQSPRNISK